MTKKRSSIPAFTTSCLGSLGKIASTCLLSHAAPQGCRSVCTPRSTAGEAPPKVPAAQAVPVISSSPCLPAPQLSSCQLSSSVHCCSQPALLPGQEPALQNADGTVTAGQQTKQKFTDTRTAKAEVPRDELAPLLEVTRETGSGIARENHNQVFEPKLHHSQQRIPCSYRVHPRQAGQLSWAASSVPCTYTLHQLSNGRNGSLKPSLKRPAAPNPRAPRAVELPGSLSPSWAQGSGVPVSSRCCWRAQPYGGIPILTFPQAPWHSHSGKQFIACTIHKCPGTTAGREQPGETQTNSPGRSLQNPMPRDCSGMRAARCRRRLLACSRHPGRPLQLLGKAEPHHIRAQDGRKANQPHLDRGVLAATSPQDTRGLLLLSGAPGSVSLAAELAMAFQSPMTAFQPPGGDGSLARYLARAKDEALAWHHNLQCLCTLSPTGQSSPPFKPKAAGYVKQMKKEGKSLHLTQLRSEDKKCFVHPGLFDFAVQTAGPAGRELSIFPHSFVGCSQQTKDPAGGGSPFSQQHPLNSSEESKSGWGAGALPASCSKSKHLDTLPFLNMVCQKTFKDRKRCFLLSDLCRQLDHSHPYLDTSGIRWELQIRQQNHQTNLEIEVSQEVCPTSPPPAHLSNPVHSLGVRFKQEQLSVPLLRRIRSSACRNCNGCTNKQRFVCTTALQSSLGSSACARWGEKFFSTSQTEPLSARKEAESSAGCLRCACLGVAEGSRDSAFQQSFKMSCCLKEHTDNDQELHVLNRKGGSITLMKA
ncbi:hypothetical protein Anapl_01680 [Anas platyrhynchos]|uniref:Uncharacterized protein n=1 Tax=Anas platyrhynchos TaxID=8839 RepID=R0KD73_ANAPL|nr:hypothetical protein Anapl_01680 [Anas platyrhynchos]